MRLLVELRPALAGHAGIPQETRLLFASLARVDGVELHGFVQGVSRSLTVPPRALRLIEIALGSADSVLTSLAGLEHRLTRLGTQGREGAIWKSLFAKTLPQEEFAAVTRRPLHLLWPSWSAAHLGGLWSARLGRAVYPRVDTRGFDILIAETPFPGVVSRGTQLVIRYHDAIPMRLAETTRRGNYDRSTHMLALRDNVERGAWFACVSEATRRDLIAAHPQAERRALTVPNMIAPYYCVADGSTADIAGILQSRVWSPRWEGVTARTRASPKQAQVTLHPGQFLLMVSTVEPRKNHQTLLAAWARLKATTMPGLQLVLVGELGWQCESILSALSPGLHSGEVHLLRGLDPTELRTLYANASATVCPSLAEGFGYSGAEAMASGGLVVASDLPVHREIYGDAAEYFDPTSVPDLVAALERALHPAAEALRARRRRAAVAVLADLSAERFYQRWSSLLERVRDAAP